MGDSMDVQIISVPIGADLVGDDTALHLFRAPADGQGGGVTVLAAYAVNGAATSGETAFALALQNWDTDGAAVKETGGTVAAAVGGTTDHWAAGTPKSFSIANGFLDAGEWLVLLKTEENSSDPTLGTVVVQIAVGR